MTAQPISRGNIRMWLACCPECKIQGEYDSEAAANNHHAYHHFRPRILMPLPSWLWPDDRSGMEWSDKHDERL